MAIVFFTDFGCRDIYVGQVKATLHQYAQNIPQIDLFHDAPSFNIQASAHLLTALGIRFAPGNIFLAVVDPGVGSERAAIVLLADGNWFVGPDNGLLSVHAARANSAKFWRIDWRPPVLSSSFHARDLFAPIVGLIARGEFPTDKLSPVEGLAVDFGAGDLGEIIWVDHYGNAMAGLRAVPSNARLQLGEALIGYSKIFSAAGKGQPLWHQNSIGLAEIAVNCGSAAAMFDLSIGQHVTVVEA